MSLSPLLLQGGLGEIQLRREPLEFFKNDHQGRRTRTTQTLKALKKQWRMVLVVHVRPCPMMAWVCD